MPDKKAGITEVAASEPYSASKFFNRLLDCIDHELVAYIHLHQSFFSSRRKKLTLNKAKESRVIGSVLVDFIVEFLRHEGVAKPAKEQCLGIGQILIDQSVLVPVSEELDRFDFKGAKEMYILQISNFPRLLDDTGTEKEEYTYFIVDIAECSLNKQFKDKSNVLDVNESNTSQNSLNSAATSPEPDRKSFNESTNSLPDNKSNKNNNSNNDNNNNNNNNNNDNDNNDKKNSTTNPHSHEASAIALNRNRKKKGHRRNHSQTNTIMDSIKSLVSSHSNSNSEGPDTADEGSTTATTGNHSGSSGKKIVQSRSVENLSQVTKSRKKRAESRGFGDRGVSFRKKHYHRSSVRESNYHSNKNNDNNNVNDNDNNNSNNNNSNNKNLVSASLKRSTSDNSILSVSSTTSSMYRGPSTSSPLLFSATTSSKDPTTTSPTLTPKKSRLQCEDKASSLPSFALRKDSFDVLNEFEAKKAQVKTISLAKSRPTSTLNSVSLTTLSSPDLADHQSKNPELTNATTTITTTTNTNTNNGKVNHNNNICKSNSNNSNNNQKKKVALEKSHSSMPSSQLSPSSHLLQDDLLQELTKSPSFTSSKITITSSTSSASLIKAPSSQGIDSSSVSISDNVIFVYPNDNKNSDNNHDHIKEAEKEFRRKSSSCVEKSSVNPNNERRLRSRGFPASAVQRSATLSSTRKNTLLALIDDLKDLETSKETQKNELKQADDDLNSYIEEARKSGNLENDDWLKDIETLIKT